METISRSQILIDKLEYYANKSDEPLCRILSNVLNISQDAAYRRIKGKVPFTFEDVVCLSSKLHFSIDELIGDDKDSLVFNYKSVQRNDFSSCYGQYVEQLATLFDHINIRDSRLFYAATDIPIYLIAKYPRIVAFKIYCWITNMAEGHTIKPFSFDDYDKLALKLDSLVSPLCEVECTEIYSARTFESCLNHISFYKELNCLSTEDLEMLKPELLILIDELELQAASGVNKDGMKCNMYLTSFDMEGTKILVDSPIKSASFVKLYLLNGIWTQNEAFCKAQLEWFYSLTDISTLISKSSIKDRKLYFSDIKDKIKQLI